MSDPLWPHGLWDTSLPYPSLSLRVCSDSCLLSQWCYLTISSPVAPFSFCPQSFPVSGSFPMALHIRWPKYWSFSISTSNEYSGLISFRIDCFDLLTVQRTLKSLLQHHKLSLAPPEMKMCECWELILLTCYRFTFSWKSNWEILFLVTNNGHCNQNLLLLEWHQKLPWDL